MKRIDLKDYIPGEEFPTPLVMLVLTEAETKQLRRLIGGATIMAASFAFTDQLMSLLDDGKVVKLDEEPVVCGTTKCPPGWTCSRSLEHDGPCAAWRLGTR